MALLTDRDDSRGTTGIRELAKDVLAHRLAIGFTIDGDLRYISHHDTLRLFRRAMARAGLPVRFSQGFNPQPRIMIPVPRPVGIASDDETVVVEVDRSVEPDEVSSDLGTEMPLGVTLKGARVLAPGEKLVPVEVCYRLDAPGAVPQALPTIIQSLLDAESLLVTRTSPKWPSPHTLNIRPFIADLSTDGRHVDCTLRVTGTGTAKPAEIAGLLGWNPDFINHHIRRLSVRWR